MASTSQTEDLLPAALVAELKAMAALEHRSIREMLREAVERYVHDHRFRAKLTQPKRTPQEAAARLLELRKGNFLPAGMTIRDLQTHGRA